MTIELTDNEILVVKLYLELAKIKANDNPDAVAGFDEIIRKLKQGESK